MVGAVLVVQTIPFAGLVLAGPRERWHDLFAICYFSAVGLLLSAIAVTDDYFDLTDWIGMFSAGWPM